MKLITNYKFLNKLVKGKKEKFSDLQWHVNVSGQEDLSLYVSKFYGILSIMVL